MADRNTLYYGDNLDVLHEHIPDESIDLVYLDPPFNSNRNYNVLFSKHDIAGADQAQIQAFGDTWRWTPVTEEQFVDLIGGGLPMRVADTLSAFRMMLGENDTMAYLVNMAPRLADIKRVLKSTGSIFLHCDPSAGHYLKILLDVIFDPTNFINEIVWAYDTGGRAKSRFPRKHDLIFWYGKSDDYFFDYDEVALPRDFSTMHETVLEDVDGRKYQRNIKNGKEYRYYLDKGVLPNDWWTDVQALNPSAKERLGYPTQKPVALLERIIRAACPKDGVVLDPFCGCGTTIDAAIRLNRRWLGIDITYIAIDLIEKRLVHTHGEEICKTFEVKGIPRDLGGAYALFSRSPFDFERWAVSLVHAQPNQKQVGDKGIDGVARFPLNTKWEKAGRQFGQILVSVKGGKNIGPQFVRDLIGTVETQKAEMGILLTMAEPTKGVLDAVNHGGTYTLPVNGQTFPRVQVITVAELLMGKRPTMPLTLLPYIQASRRGPDATTEALF